MNHQLRVFKETNHFDVDRVENFKIEKQCLNQRMAELKQNGIDLRRLIATMNVENGNATREMMARLQTTFAYLFHRIIDSDGSSGYLELRPVAAAAANGNEELKELEIYCAFASDALAEHELPFDQLSRNQKTTVALIFVLAVLQSSPYAIYLLDYIDEVRWIGPYANCISNFVRKTSHSMIRFSNAQNIDEPHRRNIANYIEERSSVSQFFVAASHTELLTTAENIFEFAPSMPYRYATMKRIRPSDSDRTESPICNGRLTS